MRLGKRIQAVPIGGEKPAFSNSARTIVAVNTSEVLSFYRLLLEKQGV